MHSSLAAKPSLSHECLVVLGWRRLEEGGEAGEGDGVLEGWERGGRRRGTVYWRGGRGGAGEGERCIGGGGEGDSGRERRGRMINNRHNIRRGGRGGWLEGGGGGVATKAFRSCEDQTV